MQKKLLALAVAGALGVPVVATAQTSTVQIFGTAYIEYSWAKQGVFGTAPLNKRNNVDILQSPGSEIGFKGEEKLGGGLSAWFQCSSTADIRGQSPEGFCSRNSALGLKGGFGNVYIGRWDTPFKRTISPTNIAGNDTGIWGTAFLLTGGSTSTLDASSRATFKRRQANMISYDSPEFAGFQVMAGYSAINGATATTTGVTNAKSRVMSLGAQYSAGPLYVSAAYETHRQFGVGAPSGVGGGLGAGTVIPVATGDNTDKGWHVGAAYTWGPVRFGGQYTQQKFEIGPGSEAKYKAWHAGVDWNIVGPHGLRAAFTQARDAKGSATVIGATNTLLGGTYRPAPCFGATAALAAANCGSGTGAKLYQIRYVYTFSKRTEFNFGYVRLNNDTRAAYSLGGLSSPNVGEDQSAWALSMRHTF
jgi:predicted porin